MLYVRLTIKVKVGIPESFKVGWYPHKITGSSHLKLFWYKVFVQFDKIKTTQSPGELRLKLNINFLMLTRVFLKLCSTIAIGKRSLVS